MSRIYEALRKVEGDRLDNPEKDILPLHEYEKQNSSDGKNIPLTPRFLLEIFQDIRKAVTSIYKIGLFSIEKSNNEEEKEYSWKAMTQSFEKFVSIVNLVSSYVLVTSPIVKKNTIHRILGKILESNEEKLHAREIEWTKTFDENLPETTFHDEQVRFILNLVLQYAILSTPSGGSIEIVTKFINNQKEKNLASMIPLKNQYSEILIFSSYSKHTVKESLGIAEVPDFEKDDICQSILRLIKEMIRRNQGMIEFQMDQMKLRTRISLKLPVERRQVAYYRSTLP